MEYIIHIKFYDGEIFLDTPYDAYPRFFYGNGKIGDKSGLNEDIISKHVVKNVVAHLLNQTPIPTKLDTKLSRFVKGEKGLDGYDKLSKSLDEVVANSYYKLNENTYSYTDRFGDKCYAIELRSGLKKDGMSERKGGDKLCGFEVLGYATWERFKWLVGMDEELFNAITILFQDMLGGINPLTIPFKDAMSRLINLPIEERVKISHFMDSKAIKGTYLKRLLELIVSGKIPPKLDVRFNLGQKYLCQKNEVKYAISISGELMLSLPEELVRMIVDSYVPTTIFDGGIVVLESVTNTEQISEIDIINMGFKKVNDLKQ